LPAPHRQYNPLYIFTYITEAITGKAPRKFVSHEMIQDYLNSKQHMVIITTLTYHRQFNAFIDKKCVA